MFQGHEGIIADGGGDVLLLGSGLERQPGWPTRLGVFADRLRDIDLIVDLGVRIGSRDWWRGAATCAALCCAVILCAPGAAPLPHLAVPPPRTAPRLKKRAPSVPPIAAPRHARIAPVAIAPLRITGFVGTGLDGAARASGAPGAAIAAYREAIAGRIDLAGDLAPGDRFDMIVARRRAATGAIETGALLYAGLEQPARTIRLLRWSDGDKPYWYGADGTGGSPAPRGAMLMPVRGIETSGFGMRVHPILGYSRMHEGVDFAAPAGAPVIAATGGVVSFAGWQGGHGNFVRLFASPAFGTGYAHLSRIAVAAGERVVAGEIIGYVGSTGLSTGPHLHFEVYRGGVPVDPMSVRIAVPDQLAGASLARFQAALARLLTVAPAAPALARIESAAVKTTLPG